MALADIVVSRAAVVRARTQPSAEELADSGFELAQRLGLDMSAGAFTVHPEVLAARLGHLRLLASGHEPKVRRAWYLQEYESVRRPKPEREAEPKPQVAAEPTPTLKDKPHRWRLKKADPRDWTVPVRVSEAELAEWQQEADRLGISVAAFVRMSTGERTALERATRQQPDVRQRETDE